ncbi:cholesterol 7-desaturase nvd-like isoform X1 [Panonychus citri]|uniref:cholesterol 7-desaturase nvd-like isoform X1 n=1 Tax=Panonychus citri TaxID=50023 RepID=UPI002306F192|nr:cholesterol 7-desaturase nvd-like isoform X1 [Panonychus citri]
MLTFGSILLSLNFNSYNLVLIVFIICLFVLILFINRPINIIRDANCDNIANLKPIYSYPNGWIGVCESIYLKDREIKRVDFCGHRIILLRLSSSNRKPYALDAYCPHLGADLSVGGKIVKNCETDCIRCPFHGWSFKVTDGQCVDVPYTKDRKPPNGVAIKTWECLELNGFIYVWHHNEGQKPTWVPEEIKEITNNKYKYMGRTEHIVNCLIQEIPENGPDFAHLNEVHAPSFLWGGKVQKNNNIVIDSISHRWESTWKKGELTDSHKAILTLKSMFYFLDCKLFELTFDRLEQIGPAIVNLYFSICLFGFRLDGCYVQSLVPLSIHKQKIIHHLYMESSLISPIVAQFLLRVEAIMLERDIEIWSNKIYLTNPKLVKEEAQIQSFRRWYSQFFSKQSGPTIKFEDQW